MEVLYKMTGPAGSCSVLFYELGGWGGLGVFWLGVGFGSFFRWFSFFFSKVGVGMHKIW